MKITEAVFLKSAAKLDEYPKELLPEVAFSGRSNVGKSSMINCLLQRHNLARTSSTPGKTRMINFYRVNRDFYFADLPGYGYAKVAKEMRRSWKWTVEEYLEHRSSLRLVVVIIDLRRGLEEAEAEFLLWLKQRRIKALLVATKADKLKREERVEARAGLIERASSLNANFIEFSARSGEGRDDLWAYLTKELGGEDKTQSP